MLAVRIIIIRSLILAFILVTTGEIYGQLKPINKGSVVTGIDTSDYIPSFYSGSINYNLMIAAYKGNKDEIIRLITKGADVNTQTDEGATPLVFAVSNNHLAAVKAILAFSPNVDVITRSVETPLLIAVKNSFFDIAEELIRAGANVNFTDRHGATPLHHASLNGFTDIVDLLLYYDAYIDPKSEEGTTPLLAAVWAGNTDIVDLLVQRGANMEEKDNDGFTPFLMASYYGDTLMMNILYKNGANIYAINKSHNNALSLSIIAGQNYVTDYLLKIGKRWADPGNNPVDPYEVAAKYRRPEMIKVLKDNNIPGHLKHEIDQVAVNLSSRFFVHDLYSGFRLSFKEPYLNAGVIAGLDVKLWETRVLVKNSENLFYQYMDKGSVAYAGLFKDFTLTDYPGKFNFSFSSGLLAGYSFGNNLKGTSISTDQGFKVIPSVSFRMEKMNLSFNLGLEYLKTKFYHVGPVWLRAGVSYNYFFDKIRTTIKPIRWN